MCQEAIKIFPDKKFDLDQDTEPGICRTYMLNENSEAEIVRAFACPTTPTIYIQVTGDETNGYTATCMIKKRKPKSRPPRGRITAIYEDVLYELQAVDSIVDRTLIIEFTYSIIILM